MEAGSWERNGGDLVIVLKTIPGLVLSNLARVYLHDDVPGAGDDRLKAKLSLLFEARKRGCDFRRGHGAGSFCFGAKPCRCQKGVSRSQHRPAQGSMNGV